MGDPGLQGPAGKMSDVDMEHMKGEKGDSGISGIKHHAGVCDMGLYLDVHTALTFYIY